jgi:hypothetical protein
MLPFVEPDRLVSLWEDFRNARAGEPALPNVLDWHERGRTTRRLPAPSALRSAISRVQSFALVR